MFLVIWLVLMVLSRWFRVTLILTLQIYILANLFNMRLIEIYDQVRRKLLSIHLVLKNIREILETGKRYTCWG